MIDMSTIADQTENGQFAVITRKSDDTKIAPTSCFRDCAPNCRRTIESNSGTSPTPLTDKTEPENCVNETQGATGIHDSLIAPSSDDRESSSRCLVFRIDCVGPASISNGVTFVAARKMSTDSDIAVAPRLYLNDETSHKRNKGKWQS